MESFTTSGVPQLDDVLQDTLAVMWKKFDNFKIGTDFVAWGKTIARYKIMNHLKKSVVLKTSI